MEKNSKYNKNEKKMNKNVIEMKNEEEKCREERGGI